jgi:hypothetical protein
METERTLKRIVAALLVLLLVPLLPAIGIMVAAAGLIAQTSMMMSGSLILCIIWAVLIATVLGTLIVLLTPDAPLEARSPYIRHLVAAIIGQNLSDLGMRIGTSENSQSTGPHPARHVAFEWWQKLARMTNGWRPFS